jgi:hypothetical protein
MTDYPDYRTLLLKYINHVGECEGTTFLSDRWHDDRLFTDEEWSVMQQLDKESYESS